MLAVGDKAPDFTVTADDGSTVSLSALKGKSIILYFYPKDNTPGCTIEACAFRDKYFRFTANQAEIFGVSKDNLESHLKFKNKYALPFRLLLDTEGKLCQAYGVWVQKSMFGKKYMGIERATFLINPEGCIQALWQPVKIKGHVQEVLETLDGTR